MTFSNNNLNESKIVENEIEMDVEQLYRNYISIFKVGYD